MKRTFRLGRSGFTLLEIMLVVMIIALLASLAIFNMGDVFGNAQENAVRANLRTFDVALLQYRAKGGDYPSTDQGLKALVERPGGDPQPMSWSKCMEEIPKDPWGRDYYYGKPGKHNTEKYDLFSAGKDGQPGTMDDIGNWRSQQ